MSYGRKWYEANRGFGIRRLGGEFKRAGLLQALVNVACCAKVEGEAPHPCPVLVPDKSHKRTSVYELCPDDRRYGHY